MFGGREPVAGPDIQINEQTKESTIVMREMQRSGIGYIMDRSYACNALSLKSAAGGHGRHPSKAGDKSLTSI
jgi:hypothetical protein